MILAPFQALTVGDFFFCRSSISRCFARISPSCSNMDFLGSALFLDDDDEDEDNNGADVSLAAAEIEMPFDRSICSARVRGDEDGGVVFPSTVLAVIFPMTLRSTEEVEVLMVSMELATSLGVAALARTRFFLPGWDSLCRTSHSRVLARSSSTSRTDLVVPGVRGPPGTGTPPRDPSGADDAPVSIVRDFLLAAAVGSDWKVLPFSLSLRVDGDSSSVPISDCNAESLSVEGSLVNLGEAAADAAEAMVHTSLSILSSLGASSTTGLLPTLAGPRGLLMMLLRGLSKLFLLEGLPKGLVAVFLGEDAFGLATEEGDSTDWDNPEINDCMSDA